MEITWKYDVWSFILFHPCAPISVQESIDYFVCCLYNRLSLCVDFLYTSLTSSSLECDWSQYQDENMFPRQGLPVSCLFVIRNQTTIYSMLDISSDETALDIVGKKSTDSDIR